ncbi:hypothetical protein GUJ93_ZPchr0008g12292 [Zizania palustris]|uniref:Uncharacterized protein n=1 Tax=Zizania palustris TaxID=103762 RepID=A0A8J5QYV1_ZIZPA|nr:hypothetical protein GUJ93_ZPchr0008g12292 [Zizania palustris]
MVEEIRSQGRTTQSNSDEGATVLNRGARGRGLAMRRQGKRPWTTRGRSHDLGVGQNALPCRPKALRAVREREGGRQSLFIIEIYMPEGSNGNKTTAGNTENTINVSDEGGNNKNTINASYEASAPAVAPSTPDCAHWPPAKMCLTHYPLAIGSVATAHGPPALCGVRHCHRYELWHAVVRCADATARLLPAAVCAEPLASVE